eukprot:3437612-Lingulodinium_polyedra.AAC.1
MVQCYLQAVGNTMSFPMLIDCSIRNEPCTGLAFQIAVPITTADLSGAACGCYVAVYLTSPRQSWRLSSCSDYHYNADEVCG